MTDSFDFSQLKSFKTPENWIETAINIPQKKKPLPFILRPYVIGTAASLVIVAAAVLTILLSSGGKPPLGNEHGFAVQPAVTVPTEIIEETNASGEVIATHVVPFITEGTTPQATEIIEVTNDSGEVIATQAVPVTSPQATGATAANTNPAQTTGGTTATEATIKPTTAGPTAPATEPVTIQTQPAWNVQETTDNAEEDDTAVEDVTDDTAATETKPPVLFTGSLTLIITPDSPLFGSVYVKLDIYNESGDKLGSTLTLCPQLRSTAGYKAVKIKPNDQGMTLYRWQTYTLRVYDANGNSSTASVTPSFAGGFTVKV